MGGGTEVQQTARQTLGAMTTPEDTFGLLRTVLEALESRLHFVRSTVERRNALAASRSDRPSRVCSTITVATTSAGTDGWPPP